MVSPKITAAVGEAYGKDVEGALQVWEVRGIPNYRELTLPPTIADLKTLSRPLKVHFRLITGKQIVPDFKQAQIVKLSQTGVALLTDLRLDDFAAVQIKVTDQTGEAVYLDAKVVGTDSYNKIFLLRFTPIDKEAAAII